MPRAFNAAENAVIDRRLRQAGARLFAQTGVVKTSIDDLAAAAGIAKGSFYKFFDSKECLYFELLEDAQENVRAPLLNNKGRSRATFESRLRTLFDHIHNDPLIQLMGREAEFTAITTKVPPNVLQAHQERDQAFLGKLIARWNMHRRPPARDAVAARMTTLVLLSIKKEFFGDRLFDHAVNAAIASFVDCFFATPVKS